MGIDIFDSKNKNSLIEDNILLLAINLIIANFFD